MKMQTRQIINQAHHEHGTFFSSKERVAEASRQGYEYWQIEEMLNGIESRDTWDIVCYFNWAHLELYILLADLPENQAEDLRELKINLELNCEY